LKASRHLLQTQVQDQPPGIAMLTGKHNRYFLRARELRLSAIYCLVLAALLALLALIDWLDNRTGEASVAMTVSVICGFYAVYLTLADKPWQQRWPEWVLVVILALLVLFNLHGRMEPVYFAYWLPFYLAFALPWRNMLILAGVFSLLFLVRLLWADAALAGQASVTYLVAVLVALAFGWMNRQGELQLTDNLGADPLTGAYQQGQLLHDLRREIPRADRQSTRLTLALIQHPASWKVLSADQRDEHVSMLALRLSETILPQQTLYRLDSDHFLVLMPNSRQSDIEGLESNLGYCLATSESVAEDCLQLLSYRADDDAATLLQRLLELDQQGREPV
jgi:GGDEF domain-containing protein